MTVYSCSDCGCDHKSEVQAGEIHAATASVHAYLRERVRLAMLPVERPVAKKKAEVLA